MKILKLLPLACTIILGAASCSDDDKEQTGFQIDDGSGFLSLDAAARSGSIAITANNSWSVTQDKDSEWLTLSTTSGAAGRTEIGIMLEANPGEARNAGLTFNSGGRTYPFVITQSAHVTAASTMPTTVSTSLSELFRPFMPACTSSRTTSRATFSSSARKPSAPKSSLHTPR